MTTTMLIQVVIAVLMVIAAGGLSFWAVGHEDRAVMAKARKEIADVRRQREAEVLPDSVRAMDVPFHALGNGRNILVYGEHGTGKFAVLMGMLQELLVDDTSVAVAVYLDPSIQPPAWCDDLLTGERVHVYVPHADDLDDGGRRSLAGVYDVEVKPFDRVTEPVVVVDAWEPDVATEAAQVLEQGRRLILADHWYTCAELFDTGVFTYRIRKIYVLEQREWAPAPNEYAPDEQQGEYLYLAQINETHPTTPVEPSDADATAAR
ncbi:hypothetical protein [Bifidobacterium crudilactis]|uniref:hypothetical protein n=1 Tax=Bifidobacterium crudilactis TaxID=327277 RepID=UPI002648E3AF|nr:hypothetical protein [Bifidobacterium crudilactis]MDN5973522.1 hypothetical protein [Bifidobacterium crudilactis]MDN6001723.1 hypothetical protein [Bifidobacterium crudilactis]MDN6210317.1 hypothetical protein [Bifidobacterium crudilactis]MDN6233965.1 hypothetical protein [Bifidobacterium crudilactis]MDN6468293.1 hypothetical protein [Bifidobacterium crudilactis]